MRSARTVFFCRNYRRCTSLSPPANRRPSWSRPCNTETSHIGNRKHSRTKVCQVSFCSGAISYPASYPFSHGLTTVQGRFMRHRGNLERFRFDPAVVPALRAFCQQEGVSSYMVLLASYVALLNRYTAQEDIVIGALSAGRRWPEVERLLGDFVNPLPLRVDLSRNPTFRDLTKRVMHVVLDALTNEQVPFEMIVKSLRLRPDPSRSSIFQIILSQQPQLRPVCPGWNLATEEVSNGASKLDLMIVIDERLDSISGPITYNTDLFDASTITRMVEHWQKLLEGGLAHPDCCISELPLLTDTERKQLLVDWNNTLADYPKDKYLHDLVQAQAERTPDAAAAEFGEARLSYRELNARANQLAHYLGKLGAGPNVLVGVCMERSLEMLVALLGIMKAGGAYVPLDP